MTRPQSLTLLDRLDRRPGKGGFTLNTMLFIKFSTISFLFFRRFLWGPGYVEARLFVRFGDDVKMHVVN